MIMVGDHPVTIVTGYVGSLSFYDLDLKALIFNNASAYRPIEEYKIAKVYNYTSGAVESTAAFSTRMSLDKVSGIWEFTNLDSEYLDIHVSFMAYNGKIWSSVNAQQLIEIILYPKPFEDTIPPIFSGALFPISLTYNKTEIFSRDWTSARWRKDKNVSYPMPNVYEQHTLPYSVQFDPGNVPFASYNSETHNVTIDQSLI